MGAVPVITVTGWSNSGKTTFVTRVVGLLTDMGVRVGVIKHHGHKTGGVDVEGKDSWKYAQAGANPVVLSASDQYAIFVSTPQGELTRAVQMDRSQVSRVLRDLAQKGYVSADAQAGYKRRYALTPSGRETAARVEAIILDINRFVSGSISDADIEIFYKTLTTITRNLQSAVETYAKGVSHE